MNRDDSERTVSPKYVAAIRAALEGVGSAEVFEGP